MSTAHLTSQPSGGNTPSQTSVDLLHIYLRFFLLFFYSLEKYPIAIKNRENAELGGRTVLCWL